MTVFGVNTGSGCDTSSLPYIEKLGIPWVRVFMLNSTQCQQYYPQLMGSSEHLVGDIQSGWIRSYVDGAPNFTLTEWANAITEAQKTFPSMHVWEIWNEPLNPAGQYGYMDGNPYHYFNLLKTAYLTIKGNDASATVIGFGGVQINGGQSYRDFVTTVMSLGGASYMDGISVHAYPTQSDLSTFNQTWATGPSSIMPLLHTYNKPLWLTETALQSGSTADNQQSMYLTESVNFFASQGFHAYFWYGVQDWVQTRQAGCVPVGVVCHMGLVWSNDTVKPAGYSYQDLITSATQASSSTAASLFESVTFQSAPSNFADATSPGTITACGNTYANSQGATCGTSFTATANLPAPSTGWQFNHWTWTGGVACSSNTANPAECSAYNSGGVLIAVYAAQVNVSINPASSASVNLGTCSEAGEGNGVSFYTTTFGSTTITACNMPSGYSILNWSCTGGLTCSTTGNPATLTINGPGSIVLNLQTQPPNVASTSTSSTVLVTDTPQSTTSTSQATQTSTASSQLTTAPIPGFPWESILTGLVLGLAALALARRRRK